MAQGFHRCSFFLVDRPGLALIEELGPQIFSFWQKMREQHPEHDDLVAVVEHHADAQFALTISPRLEFIDFMRASGKWVDGSSWDTVLQPAGGSDGLPIASAIWVVVHLPDRRSAIMRLVNPPLQVTKGGSA